MNIKREQKLTILWVQGSGDFLAEASAEVAARTMERSLEVISTSTAILNGFKKDGEEVVQVHNALRRISVSSFEITEFSFEVFFFL